jgi:hypothetical protein
VKFGKGGLKLLTLAEAWSFTVVCPGGTTESGSEVSTGAVPPPVTATEVAIGASLLFAIGCGVPRGTF